MIAESGPHVPIQVNYLRTHCEIRLASKDETNRLTRECVRELHAAVRMLRPDPKPLIITGNPKFFSAGAELAEIQEISGSSALDFARMGQDLMNAIAQFPCPAYAAIHGYCLGGGLDLALACHRRIASPHAVFGHRGAALGLVTGWGGTQRLPRIVGKARALQMLVAAENPLIICDRVSRTPAGLSRMVELAEALQCPVVDNAGRMNFPSRHPLNQTFRGRALVAQADRFGTTFISIAIFMLAVVFFVGVATVRRLLMLNRDDYVTVVGMNRLRHGYLEMHPELEQNFTSSHYDDLTGALRTLGVEAATRGGVGSFSHRAVTLPGMVGVVVSAVGAAIAGLAAVGLGAPIYAVILAGAAAFVVTELLIMRTARHSFRGYGPGIEPRFPTPKS